MKIPVYVVSSTEMVGECCAIAEVNFSANTGVLYGRIVERGDLMRTIKNRSIENFTERFARLRSFEGKGLIAVEEVAPSQWVEACQFWERAHFMVMSARFNGVTLSQKETAYIGCCGAYSEGRSLGWNVDGNLMEKVQIAPTREALQRPLDRTSTEEKRADADWLYRKLGGGMKNANDE